MPSVKFYTLGCRVNQYDTELIREEFEGSGFSSKNGGSPDVCVINTCTVTGRTDREARKLIRRTIKEYPDASVIVTGCYARTHPEKLNSIPGIDLVAKNKEEIEVFLGLNPKNYITNFANHSKAFVKIQDGCDEFCAYCIVPFARGTPISRDIQEILTEIKALGKRGYKVFVLTGINIGKYSSEFRVESSELKKTNLVELLEEIEKQTEVEWVGLSSIEPLTVTDQLIDFARNSKKFMNHFHISLQSGDNKILKNMNRNYTREYFKDLILKISNEIKDVNIGIDVICGLPEEDEVAFQNTYSLIEELPISYLHIFRYSIREGTKAPLFPNQVSEKIKTKRIKAIKSLSMKKSLEFRKRVIGKTSKVLVESNNSENYLIGETSNYIKILFNGPKNLIGSFVTLRIKKVDECRTYGDLLNI